PSALPSGTLQAYHRPPPFRRSSAVSYPRMVRIRQHFERPRVEDVPGAVAATLDRLSLGQRIRPGHTVALTAGSRGIANIPLILRATADFLKRAAPRPFPDPPMGL